MAHDVFLLADSSGLAPEGREVVRMPERVGFWPVKVFLFFGFGLLGKEDK